MGGIQCCGWDAADHKDFLRIKTKHKDKFETIAFMTELRRAIATVDEDEIKNHISQFKQMIKLVEKKKSLMA